MKIISRILSVVLAMSMLFGTVTFAATYKDVAQDKNYYSAVSLLSALDIIKGYEDGTFGPEKNVTRAEFAVMLIRTLGLSGVGNSDPAGLTFKDLGTVAWAVSDIRTAFDLGIINGMSAEQFAPDNQVTYEQAIKMIVCALGYEPVALDRVGGDKALIYPDGYLAVATQNNIDGGVGVVKGQPAKRFEIAKLIYNSLEIDLMEKSLAIGSDQYVIRKGKTILSDKLRIRTSTGELKADEKTSISTNGQVSKAGEVLITEQGTTDEEIFLKGTIATDGMVGHSIKYYFREDNNGLKTLAYLESKTKNSAILKINASNIDKVTGTIADGVTIEYWVNKETDRNTEKATLAANSSVVINGRTATGVDPEVDFMPLSGEIELMSSSSNGTFDKIFVTSYETYVVNTISSTDKKIFDMYRPSTTGNEMILDEDSNQVILKMVNESNAPVAFTSLAKWNVLTIKQTNSSGKNTMDVMVSTKSVTGSITELDKDNHKLKISGKDYEFSKYFEKYFADFGKLTIDDDGKFYLDKEGKIAAFDQTASRANNYGYLAGSWVDSDVRYFKFMLQNGTSISPNGVNVKGAKKIKINGLLATAENLDTLSETPQLVKYSVNGAGEIESILLSKSVLVNTGDLVESIKLTKDMVYNFNSREFSNATTKKADEPLAKFMVDSTSNIFVVPVNSADYDSYTKISYRSLTNNLTRNAIAYDLTGTGSVKTAKAVVIIGDDPRATVSDDTPISIISGITSVVQDGISVQKITAYTYGVGKTGATENFYTESATTLDSYAIGDVIRFGTTPKGYIKDGSVASILDVHAPTGFLNRSTESVDAPVYKAASGCLYSVSTTDTPQTFELAKTVIATECETADKNSFTIAAGLSYLKYPGKLITPAITKTDLINMVNGDYYTKQPELAPESKKAAQVFVYSVYGIVKVIYYYNIQD